MGKFEDLTNKQFGSLTVLERDYEYQKIHNLKSSAPYWKCKCECGNIISVRGDSLKQKKTTSCGCYQKQQIRKATMKKLEGKYFGKILVLKDLENSNNQNRAQHLCQCGYCGTQFILPTVGLTNGRVSSCGCIKSKGEQKISEILTSNNIIYIREYKFPNLISKNGKELRFDFYLPEYNTLIEYQGIQHYSKKSNYYSSEIVEHDKMKKNFCLINNIKLIEITYKDFINLNYEFIKNKIIQGD